MTRAAVLLVLLAVGAEAAAVSPVQKVIELLEECKGKIVKDLKAEEAQMEEYSAFCDKELSEKGYAIKTADRAIADLKASVLDSQALMGELTSEIETLGTEMAAKDKELATVTSTRTTERTAFEAAEKELLGTIDELTRAVVEIKKTTSFLQVRTGTARGRQVAKIPQDRLKRMTQALSTIVNAAWVQSGDKRVLSQFLQEASGEDDDLSLNLHAKDEQAPEGGGLLETLEGMKEKAEDSLTEQRKKETSAGHSFEMMEQGLQNEIKVAQDKKADASGTLEAETQALGKAQAELVETEKTKAADEEYAASLTAECQQTSAAWASRQAEAKEEMAAVDKAKDILASGVKVFVQMSASTHDVDDVRSELVGRLKNLAQSYHSFALVELVTAARSDPFVKIRGLIEDMIAKLVAEAQEEATQKAFCDEEMGKSKKSQTEKTNTLDKLKARAEKAETTKATLEQSIKDLEAEIADIDAAQAEATKMRTAEKEEATASAKDFRDSADATEQAIVVLRQYYEGALIQVAQHTAKAPSFGGAKGDTGHTIISILEMAAEDFTKSYTEIEAEESKAAAAYEKLTQENKVSRATKEAEAKGKASEIKSLSVELENTNTDIDGVTKELDAVLDYLEKLKPQCETKAMSYAEKKAKREAEIAGLKEALSILAGEA